MDKYVENPWIDFHDYAKAELEKMGKFYDRKPVKNTNLGLIYGMGVGKLAEGNGMTVEEHSEVKSAVRVLSQGSAAACTKEAIIRYHAAKHPSARIVLNVHDQVTVSVPKKILKPEMEVLRQTMESVEFDVSILSEGAISSTNWDELQDYDKKGKVL